MQDINSEISHDVDTELLELLVCPITRGPLIYDKEKQELISQQARKTYPIRMCPDYA